MPKAIARNLRCFQAAEYCFRRYTERDDFHGYENIPLHHTKVLHNGVNKQKTCCFFCFTIFCRQTLNSILLEALFSQNNFSKEHLRNLTHKQNNGQLINVLPYKSCKGQYSAVILVQRLVIYFDNYLNILGLLKQIKSDRKYIKFFTAVQFHMTLEY